MHLVCRCSLPVWRRSFFKKGTPVTYFGPTLYPPLGGSGRKTTTLVRDHEYFIPTKFHQNPSSGFGAEVENVKSLRTDDDDDGRTDGRTTDDGRCAMTIAHSSLRLRWAKKRKFKIKTCLQRDSNQRQTAFEILFSAVDRSAIKFRYLNVLKKTFTALSYVT